MNQLKSRFSSHENRTSVVLGRFKGSEKSILSDLVSKANQILADWWSRGIACAMNDLNANRFKT